MVDVGSLTIARCTDDLQEGEQGARIQKNHLIIEGNYYINDDGTLAYDSSGDKVTLTYDTATAKELADTKWTQSEIDAGKAPTGADTNTVKTIGLTNVHKDKISGEAHSRLISTDWYACRKAEAGTAIPSDVATYRAAVRTAAADMHTKIDAADTVAKLEALYVYNTDTPPTRPLGDWPDSVEQNFTKII